MNNYIEFCNLIFRGLTKDILLTESNDLKIIITVNAEFIVKANNNERFKKIISNNYATFDGEIPYKLAKKRYPNIKIEKISGSDFIYDMAEFARKTGKKMFLLGGYEESNGEAVTILKNRYNIDISGYSPPHSDYPFSKDHNNMIIEKIKKAKPDILFVGFGAVKQEFWIEDNIDELKKIDIKWVVPCGGTFEFVSGKIKRAPIWIQKAGLEGVYRFVAEPKFFRLKRLFISLKMFKYL